MARRVAARLRAQGLAVAEPSPHAPAGRASTELRGDDDSLERALRLTATTRHSMGLAANERGLGIPIVGDPLYGRGTGPAQLKLHATELGFLHPRTGERVQFQVPPPF